MSISSVVTGGEHRRASVRGPAGRWSRAPVPRRPRCSSPTRGSWPTGAPARQARTGRASSDRACSSAPTRGELARFRAAASAALPREGRWFPRVELTGGRLGAARPPRARGAVTRRACVVGPPGDPRTAPRRKGPDLELLARLRAARPRAGSRRAAAARRGRRAARGRPVEPAVVGGRGAVHDARRGRAARRHARRCCWRSRASAGSRCACARRWPASWRGPRRG